MIVLEGLEDSFDNERAEEMLGLSIGRITHTSALIRKSMYDFDLETPEGIEKLMALLPIMDPEILKDIMTEIWPGYPTDIDARRHRLEIKGFLKDYLVSYEQQNEDEQLQGSEDPGGASPGEVEGGSSLQDVAQGGANPPSGGESTQGTPPDGTNEQVDVAQTFGA